MAMQRWWTSFLGGQMEAITETYRCFLAGPGLISCQGLSRFRQEYFQPCFSFHLRISFPLNNSYWSLIMFPVWCLGPHPRAVLCSVIWEVWLWFVILLSSSRTLLWMELNPHSTLTDVKCDLVQIHKLRHLGQIRLLNPSILPIKQSPFPQDLPAVSPSKDSLSRGCCFISSSLC